MLGRLLTAASEVFLPSLCLYCRHPLPGGDRGLCGLCWSRVVPAAGSCCPRCGNPADADDEACLACHQTPPPQEGTVVWGEYSGALRAAIIALKHGRRDELARPLGRRLAAAVAVAGWADEIEVVAAIPSHPAHHVRRGYSAASLVARAVASECELVFTSPLRRHGTGRQTGRSRAQRLQLPRRCFSVRGGIAGRRLLVVDDVSTTGTTLRRAAESALEGGARAVFCAALARTPDPRRPA